MSQGTDQSIESVSDCAGCGEKILSFLGDVSYKIIPSHHLANDFEKRMEICKNCEKFVGGFCSVCKCICAIKTKLARESCPLGKWPQIT